MEEAKQTIRESLKANREQRIQFAIDNARKQFAALIRGMIGAKDYGATPQPKDITGWSYFIEGFTLVLIYAPYPDADTGKVFPRFAIRSDADVMRVMANSYGRYEVGLLVKDDNFDEPYPVTAIVLEDKAHFEDLLAWCEPFDGGPQTRPAWQYYELVEMPADWHYNISAPKDKTQYSRTIAEDLDALLRRLINDELDSR